MFLICLKIRAIGMKKNNSNNIKVVAASVCGPMHCYRKMPCQDFFKHKSSGKNFVAVVSDGAGSAKYGKIGARVICETIVDLLSNCDFENIHQHVVRAISVARNKLLRHRFNKQKNADGLMDFSATIVGVVCFHRKGLFFHIGDGAALAICEDDINNFIVSPPSNGNFSCETFFYTQDNWIENLRFTPFENTTSK